jgi:hypothetical protein
MFCRQLGVEINWSGRAAAAQELRWALSGIAARNRLVGVLMALVLACAVVELRAEPVAVRYPEGLVHGFLVLRTLDGRSIADGDLSQVASGVRVTSRLTFRFRDGSLYDESAVFTQRDQFRLVSYRLVQKGKSFPRPLEMSIDGGSGQVQVRYTTTRVRRRPSRNGWSCRRISPTASCRHCSRTYGPRRSRFRTWPRRRSPVS